jgi:hypothetical protein
MEHSALQLNGHTAPAEKLRFMDRYLASGSRCGPDSFRMKNTEPGKLNHGALAWTRARNAERCVKVYNRTTMEHSALQLNGHTAPAEKLRFMDRYLAGVVVPERVGDSTSSEIPDLDQSDKGESARFAIG